MAHENDDTRFDVRVVRYHIRRGKVTDAEYQAFLKTLPDEAEHGVQTSTEFVAQFGDGSDDGAKG